MRALGAVALGVLISIGAAAFDSPSLYVPGVALVLLGAGCWLWVGLAAQGAGVTRAAGSSTVEEEDPYLVRLEVRRGLLPPPGGRLDEPLLERPLRVRRHSPGRLRVEVSFGRRGHRRLAPARLVIEDPLGISVRELFSEPAEVLVLPRVYPIAGEAAGALKGLGSEAERLAASAAELELDSLRPYRQGAPASRIHWPTVARTGEMVERKLIADVDLRPLVVVDPRRPPSEEALDEALRAAASLCVHLAAAGGCALLLPGDRRPSDIDRELHSWPPLHARLALVQASDPMPVTARLDRSGAVFWVAAGGGEAPIGLARARAGSRFLVVPEPLRARPPDFSVAGCAVHRVGHRPTRRAA